MSSNSKALTWWMGATVLIASIAYGVIRWITPTDAFYRAADADLILGISEIGRTDVLTALLLAAWLAGTSAFLSRKGSTLWLFAVLAFYLVPTLFDQLQYQFNIRPNTLVPWSAIAHGMDLSLSGVNTATWIGAALEMIILLSPGMANLGSARSGLMQVIAVALLTGSITYASYYFGPEILAEGVPNPALGFIGYAGFAGAASGNKWPFVAFAGLFAFTLFNSLTISVIILATALIGHATRALGDS